MGKMIGWGKQDGGLYYMSYVCQAPISYHVTPLSTFWHQRLGHPSLVHLKLLSFFILFVTLGHRNDRLKILLSMEKE